MPNYENMGKIVLNPSGLVKFSGKGKYSEPEFTWTLPVVPTGLKFFNSNNYGPEYKNDLFVGDANTGTVYDFNLNESRTGFKLRAPLADKIANNSDELKEVIFAKGFGRITDLQLGPDGNLYILSTSDKGSSVYRILNYNIIK